MTNLMSVEALFFFYSNLSSLLLFFFTFTSREASWWNRSHRTRLMPRLFHFLSMSILLFLPALEFQPWFGIIASRASISPEWI
jgi:hypothetical protein